jgi:hypothetical protein
MTKYRFREANFFEKIGDIMLKPLMNAIATGKDAHWWDWTLLENKEVDKKVKQVHIKSDFPQMRQYKKLPLLGRYNPLGVKDLYITLRVLKEVAVLEPKNFKGDWSLVIRGYYPEKKYIRSNFIQRGRVKVLIDGKKSFLGITKKGKYIPLKLVEKCPREKHFDMLFV